MYSNFLYLIIIILISILITGFLYFDKKICNTPSIKVYDSKKSGPNIIFISGTHGDELAPYYAIKEYLDKYPPHKGKIKHIVANQCGMFFKNRQQGPFNFNKDINRSYDSNYILNNKIINEIENSDLIIDFHESSGIHYKNKTKIGNTMTFNTNHVDVYNMINLLNEKYANTNWGSYNTTSFKDEDWIKGSLVSYCTKNKLNYILIETYKGYNILYRKNQINTILTYLYIKYFT